MPVHAKLIQWGVCRLVSCFWFVTIPCAHGVRLLLDAVHVEDDLIVLLGMDLREHVLVSIESVYWPHLWHRMQEY